MWGTWSGHPRPGRSRVVALSACGYKFREQLSDEYSGFHWSSWQVGAHGGEPDLYAARSGQCSSQSVFFPISATVLPMALLAWTGKQLAGQQGRDSSCHSECRSPSLDRVRDLSLYSQWRGRSHHVAKNHENLIEPIKRINLTMPRSSEPTVRLRLGLGARVRRILYIVCCFVP